MLRLFGFPPRTATPSPLGRPRPSRPPVLQWPPRALLLPIDNAPKNAMPGLTCWMGKDLHSQLNHTVRIMPDGPWDGFYLAYIAKPQ